MDCLSIENVTKNVVVVIPEIGPLAEQRLRTANMLVSENSYAKRVHTREYNQQIVAVVRPINGGGDPMGFTEHR